MTPKSANSRTQSTPKQHRNSPPSETTTRSTKRRKLNDLESSPSTPKAFQALKDVIGGVFRFGKTKLNEADELSSEGDLDIYPTTLDPSAEDLEDELALVLPCKSEALRSKFANKDDVVVQSKSTSLRRRVRGRDQILQQSKGVRGQKQEDQTHHTPSSSRRKKSELEDTQAQDVAEDSTMRSSARDRRKPRRYSVKMAEGVDMEFTDTPGSWKKGRAAQKMFVAPEIEDNAEDGTEPTTAGGIINGTGNCQMLGSQKLSRPTRKISRAIEQADVHEQIKSAKSNPRKTRKSEGPSPKLMKKRGRPPKAKLDLHPVEDSIMIENDTVEDEDAQDSEEDDILCAICSDGTSEPPNEILLCENCDLAVHQKCYNIVKIPEGDWLCKGCSGGSNVPIPDVDIEVTLVKPSLHANTQPDIEELEYNLQLTQRLVLQKLTGRRGLKLHGLAQESAAVRQVVQQTVLAGEGNSMLIIGARGSGKTVLVESIIEEISESHRDNFHVVRLNGFVHTDDKLALREIWRQLGREMDIEDSLINKTNNASDILASLLALLSHPSEISNSETNHTAKSVIFIIDEFDLFTYHPRQTLLYNLFDIAQSRKAPIAVLGVTTKIDVVESLEKRVKSRFSHRYVHLPLPKSLPAFWEICRSALVLPADEIVDQGLDPGHPGGMEFLAYWESMIETLYTTDATFKQQLEIHFYRSKSITAFLTDCILPIANMTVTRLPLTGKQMISLGESLSPPDSKLHLLQHLSDLDLAILIAAARLDIILDTDTCNFAMAYDEYSTLTSRHKVQTSSTGVAALGAGSKIWSQDVVMGSWERLIEYELLTPAGIGGGGMGNRDVGREGKMWKVDIGLEEIPGSVEGLSTIMTKWCQEI